jgi:hypothetical protein
MPQNRRRPRGMTFRGTPFTHWHEATESAMGAGWWRDRAKRIAVARHEASLRGPRFSSAVRTGKIGVKIHVKADQLDRRLKRLPQKLALSIQRKAIRKGLLLWRSTLRGLFGQHRTDYARPHLADHVAVVSRVYRRGKHRLAWGAVGIRKGTATGKQMERAVKSTVAQGVDARGTYRNAFTRKYFRELPGWRLHFLESGTYSNRRNGVLYFVKVMNAQGPAVERAIANEIRLRVAEVTR